jgi:hypothetical protein
MSTKVVSCSNTAGEVIAIYPAKPPRSNAKPAPERKGSYIRAVRHGMLHNDDAAGAK